MEMLTQETRVREKGREKKQIFEQGGIRKKRKIDRKMWQKDRQQEIVRDIKNFISKSLYQKLCIKNVYMEKFILKSLYQSL